LARIALAGALLLAMQILCQDKQEKKIPSKNTGFTYKEGKRQ